VFGYSYRPALADYCGAVVVELGCSAGYFATAFVVARVAALVVAPVPALAVALAPANIAANVAALAPANVAVQSVSGRVAVSSICAPAPGLLAVELFAYRFAGLCLRLYLCFADSGRGFGGLYFGLYFAAVCSGCSAAVRYYYQY
jgi:hypothetical protein